MGESSACLVRSFSQPSSPTPSEEKKRNSIQRVALTSSISFGRFVSESLDWEKFSAFTQNRYLEEAEKYSKPGSVAEKKAYFEAHYKRRRAAALLEQQNAAAAAAAASNFSETNTANEVKHNSPIDSELAKGNSYLVTEKIKEGEVCNCNTDTSVGLSGCPSAEIDTKSEEVEQASKPSVLDENSIESTHTLEKNEYLGDVVSTQEDKACEDGCTTRISASSSENKPEVSSSSKALKKISAIKQVPSIKPIVSLPVQLRSNNSNVRDSSNKRRSNSASLHMSINLDSCAGESQKVKYTGLPMMSNSRLVKTPAKKTQNSTLSQTSARASVNGTIKHHSTTPSLEKRNTNLHYDSISGSRIVEGKVKALLTSYSKSSSAIGSKAQSPTVSSSFTFKSEERAAKRKEFFQKLEQKFKPEMSDKQQRYAKPQVRAGNDVKDHLKANKNGEIPLKTESLGNLPKKVTTAIPCSPKTKERVAFRVQENNDSRPPWRFSTKTDSSKEVVTVKNNRPPIYSAKSFLRKSTSENASPNIQL